MKKIILAAAVTASCISGSAWAQSPTNSTIQGNQTAPSNSAGTSSAAAPTSQLNQTGVGTGTAQLPGDKAANQPTTANSGNAVATTPSK